MTPQYEPPEGFEAIVSCTRRGPMIRENSGKHLETGIKFDFGPYPNFSNITGEGGLIYPQFPLKFQGILDEDGETIWAIDAHNVLWAQKKHTYGWPLQPTNMKDLEDRLTEEEWEPIREALHKGFEHPLLYPDGIHGVPVMSEGLVMTEDQQGLNFGFEQKIPMLPLKAHGESWHRGWDIPTRWAVDAINQCWMDNAHGHALEPVSASTLLGHMEDHSDSEDIRKALDMKPEPPEWVKEALAHGWTPPKEVP